MSVYRNPLTGNELRFTGELALRGFGAGCAGAVFRRQGLADSGGTRPFSRWYGGALFRRHVEGRKEYAQRWRTLYAAPRTYLDLTRLRFALRHWRNLPLSQ